MIHTVVCSFGEPEWQCELLELSWARVRQPGELVRLVARPPAPPAPTHRHARVVATTAWSPHPYTGDVYPPYHKAAAILEWLFGEQVDGTILLVEPRCVFRAAVTEEARAGQAKAMAWPERPRGDGPFDLGRDFGFLDQFCVDRALELDAVKLPLIIHSSDLRKIAARWLELMSLIRAETALTEDGPLRAADDVAYLIAAAEARIPHAAAELATDTHAIESAAPIIDCQRAVESASGAIVWDASGDGSLDHPVDPLSAKAGTGRELLTLLAELRERRAHRHELTFMRPLRGDGVRTGKIYGSIFLEIPGRADTLALDSSGAAIWEACDGTHTIADIHRTLESRFELPQGSLQPDTEAVLRRLEQIGALRFERL